MPRLLPAMRAMPPLLAFAGASAVLRVYAERRSFAYFHVHAADGVTDDNRHRAAFRSRAFARRCFIQRREPHALTRILGVDFLPRETPPAACAGTRSDAHERNACTRLCLSRTERYSYEEESQRLTKNHSHHASPRISRSAEVC